MQEDLFYVHGVNITLHRCVKVFPEPELPAELAPLRLIIRGEYKSWRVRPLEDLRELSPNQQREQIDEEGWMISFHGSHEAPLSSQAPGIAGPSSTPTPAPGNQVLARLLCHQWRLRSGGALSTEDPPYEEVSLWLTRTVKPLYSLRRVLQKVPKAVKEDQALYSS